MLRKLSLVAVLIACAWSTAGCAASGPPSSTMSGDFRGGTWTSPDGQYRLELGADGLNGLVSLPWEPALFGTGWPGCDATDDLAPRDWRVTWDYEPASGGFAFHGTRDDVTWSVSAEETREADWSVLTYWDWCDTERLHPIYLVWADTASSP